MSSFIDKWRKPSLVEKLFFYPKGANHIYSQNLRTWVYKGSQDPFLSIFSTYVHSLQLGESVQARKYRRYGNANRLYLL